MQKLINHPRIFVFLLWQFFASFAPWIGILVVYFTKVLNLSFSQVMLLQSIFMLSNTVFEVPTGVFGDRFGRKLSLILSSVFYTTGFSFYLFQAPFIFYALGEILMGIGRAFSSGSDEALIYDTFKEFKLETHYQKFVSVQRSISVSAFLLSGVLGSALLFLGLSLKMLWLISIFVDIAGLIILLFIKEPKIKPRRSLSPSYSVYLKAMFKTIKDSVTLKSMVTFFIVISLARYLTNWSSQPLFLYFKVPVKYYSLLILTLVNLIALLIHQVILRQKKSLNYSTVSLFLIGINFAFVLSLIVNKFIPSVYWIIAFSYVFYRAILQEFMSILRSFWQPYIQSFNRATVLSGISFLNTLLFALINPFWGKLLDINVFWSNLTVIPFLSILAILIFFSTKNQTQTLST